MQGERAHGQPARAAGAYRNYKPQGGTLHKPGEANACALITYWTHALIRLAELNVNARHKARLQHLIRYQ
jgi:hypothetical protein